MIAQIISRIMSPLAGDSSGERDPLSNFWYNPVDTAGSSSLKIGTAFACIRVRSNTVGALPWHIYEDSDDGETKRAKDHPVYRTLHDQPNVWQTAFEFRQMAQTHIDLRGNFYARWYPPSLAQPWPQLVPLDPDRMTVRQLDNFRVQYEYRHQTQGLQNLSQDEVFHRMGPTFDGLTGVTPLTYARETIGLSVAQTEHAKKAFDKGGFVKWYLTTTKRLDDQGWKNWRKRFAEMTKAGEVPLFEDDMKPGTLGMTMADAQWIESRKFTGLEICQFFDVPPHLVFLEDGDSKGNAEQKQLNYLTMHLNPELVAYEQAIQPFIGDGYYARFTRDAILRADLKTRYEAHQTAVGGPFKTADEARRDEDLPPLGGDAAKLRPAPNASLKAPTGKKFNQPVEEESDDEEARGTDLRPIIEDAAGRIVAAEVRDVRKHASSADFSAWSAKFYGRHSQYMGKVLAPLEGVTGRTVDVDQLCVESLTELGNANGNLLALLDGWEANKAGQLADRLEAVLCPN